MQDIFRRLMAIDKDLYTIEIKGLKQGEHQFKFNVSKSFFAQIEESEIRDGDVEVNLVVQKYENMLELNFDIEGEVEVVCDRCLEWFLIPISFQDDLMIKILHTLPEDSEQGDKIWFINPNDYKIDLTHHIYESIFLSLPIQRFHGVLGTSEKDCDKVMMDRFKSLSVGDELNSTQNYDSRWDKLKNLSSN